MSKWSASPTRCRPRMATWLDYLLAGLVVGHAFRVFAGEPSADPFEFFETQIRPVLVDKCYPCHSAMNGKAKGGLLLDSRAGGLKGGDDGPAIVPGKPDESLLIKAIRYTDPELRMPPVSAGGKLAPETIAAFETWVMAGAPDPRSSVTTPPVGGGHPMGTKARDHWAFKPVQPPALPTRQDPGWERTPVDAFVLAKLEARHLKPAPPADKHALLRRAYFDLLGLPPSPREMAEFLADESKDAFEKLVDRLLDSPR
jgi:hypothetical protein